MESVEIFIFNITYLNSNNDMAVFEEDYWILSTNVKKSEFAHYLPK